MNSSIVKAGHLESVPRARAVREALPDQFEEVDLLLAQGQASQAQTRIAALTKAARNDDSLLAQARCLLSQSLEMQSRYSEALAAISQYEMPEARMRLNPQTAFSLRVQLGLAYNYTGDYPKAIAILKAALGDATEPQPEIETGAAHAALARVYRSINEYGIARDHTQKALTHYRQTGDWRGLAESYFALAVVDLFEGRYESTLEHLKQALILIGERPAAHLSGKIYNNMAGACWFLKRPQEGIGYLEKAISYYEGTEHKANAIDGYNNLGINLTLVGEWERAQQALGRALTLARELKERGIKEAIILDSLGELLLLRGELDEARKLLERAIEIAAEQSNKWYAWQPLRTLGRYRLAVGESAQACELARQVLMFGEQIGDRQAICEANLLAAEAHLMANDLSLCESALRRVAEEESALSANPACAGQAQRLYGQLALAQGDDTLAAHHFGRSVSIYEMLGDCYQIALAHYWLGYAYAKKQPDKAKGPLHLAAGTFQRLGALVNLARAKDALAALAPASIPLPQETLALTRLLTLRLTEAVTSRELLLRELAAVICQETAANKAMIIETERNNPARVIVAHGWTETESAELVARLREAGDVSKRERIAADSGASLITLQPPNARPALLLVSPSAAKLPSGPPIDALLRVVEVGLDSCALRELEQATSDEQELDLFVNQSLLPGFIYASPAMSHLVDEILRIRTSNVTVLVTGESGTGKELVARAVHAHSSRRSKAFVPFNCTAVPKELSDAYLFGYKRGAYTGAVADSPGVIRAAAGGTLFLDEVGDLPSEIQPKLLRFLQEGEIQPLGEQRPAAVDVRIIAATNTDLEAMVAKGRFREDLYYRLNVIRLRVPPLRERRLEIPSLVNHYLNHYSTKFARREIQISQSAVDVMRAYDWPGNVRQLCNEIQRLVARTEDGTLITPDHLSSELKHSSAAVVPAATASTLSHHFWQDLTLPQAMDRVAQQMISEAMRKHSGNVTRVARELGVSRRGLQLKLARYGLSTSI